MQKKMSISAFVSGALFAMSFVVVKRFTNDILKKKPKPSPEPENFDKKNPRVVQKDITRERRAQSSGFDDFTLSLDYPDISIIDATPIIRNDRTMLPMHALAAALGLNALWNDYSRTATLQNRDITIAMTLGSNVARVNGHDVCVDAPAIAWRDVIFLPVRFIAEEMGCKVIWSEENRKVIVKGSARA